MVENSTLRALNFFLSYSLKNGSYAKNIHLCLLVSIQLYEILLMKNLFFHSYRFMNAFHLILSNGGYFYGHFGKKGNQIQKCPPKVSPSSLSPSKCLGVGV